MDAQQADEPVERRDEIAVRARRALVEAERRGIPPEPRVFELFYVYLEGVDDRLIQAVDALLAPGAGAGLDALERIYEEHLALGDRAGRYVQLGEQVERELDELGQALDRRAESNRAYVSRLVAARDEMSILTRPGAVKRAVRELIETTGSQARDAARFDAELDAARAQIGKMRRELRELRERAYADHLTGLANRRRFDLVLEYEVAAQDGRGPFCVVLCDIDHFKRVNDAFGHPVGDSVLQQFARLIRQNVQGKDTAARYGGEEFGLVLPMTEALGARHVAERIRQALASRVFVVSGTRRRIGSVTASFGVAEHRPGETAQEVVARADAALYAAKRAGRNRVATARD